MGRLVEKKGFSVLIDACGELARRGLDFECEIIGTGDLHSALTAQIARLQLDGHVRLCGPRPQQDVIHALRDAAVFAAPCVVGADGNRDGLPTVLLEAMALGTPCVSTDVTGIPEVIRDGETGIIVPQHDEVGLANALETLLLRPELRIHLSAQARSLIEQDFDIHQNAATIRGLFGSAINQSQPCHSSGKVVS